MASLRSTTTAAASLETHSAGHERASLLVPVEEFLDATCYCSVSGRCFVRTAIIPLRWYEVVVNEKGLGAMLDAEHTVFDRQEWNNVGASTTSCSATAAARPPLVDVGEFFVVPEAVPDPMTITDGSAVEDSRESSIGCGINANATARRRGEVLAKRRVYRMLLALGYVVRSGLKLGCDFLVYKGQQGRTHAEYAVLVTGAQGAPTTWADVACKSRLCAAVGKKLVVVDTEGQNWLVKRWKF
eukprot:g12149.t1